MSERAFDANVRLWLHRRYFPFGQWENNKTGFGESYHAPFGGKGGADLVGWLGPLHIEIENKTKRGVLKTEQKLRQSRMTKPWAPLYVVCRETGRIDEQGIDEGFHELCVLIDAFARKWLPSSLLQTMGVKP